MEIISIPFSKVEKFLYVLLKHQWQNFIPAKTRATCVLNSLKYH